MLSARCKDEELPPSHYLYYERICITSQILYRSSIWSCAVRLKSNQFIPWCSRVQMRHFLPIASLNHATVLRDIVSSSWSWEETGWDVHTSLYACRLNAVPHMYVICLKNKASSSIPHSTLFPSG